MRPHWFLKRCKASTYVCCVGSAWKIPKISRPFWQVRLPGHLMGKNDLSSAEEWNEITMNTSLKYLVKSSTQTWFGFSDSISHFVREVRLRKLSWSLENCAKNHSLISRIEFRQFFGVASSENFVLWQHPNERRGD